MAPHNRKKTLTYLAHHRASTFGYNDNGDPPRDSSFFLLSEYENN